MGTETSSLYVIHNHYTNEKVKLNNPLMGTETSFTYCVF